MPHKVFLILYACYPSNSDIEIFLYDYLNLFHVTRFPLEKNITLDIELKLLLWNQNHQIVINEN